MRISVPSKLGIAQYWANVRPEFVIDIGEPSCFACHLWMNDWDTWQTAILDRCHIVAANCGGNLEPENFLLLCVTCHREAPMANDPAIMIDWALRHESWIDCVTREMQSGLRGCSNLDMDITHIERFNLFLRARAFDRHPMSDYVDSVKALIPMMRAYISSLVSE